MALFGFNKQKVLANAEKYVQQGKLSNAISEYEKVLKNDAKDLTVTNTVGDLYSRLGETSKATGCFKTVGDAYASQGFTVKAIAMYKKICKLQPALESSLKLAELYTQQGLFNDARAQYLQVAEEFLKAGELENAVRIFQKILEMDPENGNMRIRLAEVYIRLGKKNEAWQIFTSAAESLRSKGSLSGAEEILQRMLKLDPGNTYALLMQGKNMLESGDAAGAVATLQKISDLDSNPDGLRDLLKAYLQTGQLSDAGAIANKLLTVHNDLPAIASFADALMQAGQYENALQVFDQHAERLLSENSSKVLESLHTIIGHVRDNPDCLQKLLDLLQKAGDTSHVGEVLELLAHASVQSGDLTRARDLYQKLAQIEPQNPLHMQNYQQVVNQIGGTSGAKLITPEEAVVLLDDLEATAPSIHQHYSDEVALAVRSALTDAELFISYNMPAKALGPLVAALPLAPNDLRINQRLATLHTRASRFAEAAVCCRTLQSIYSEAEYPEEATRYGELAERYEERSSVHKPGASDDEAPACLDAPAPQLHQHVAQQNREHAGEAGHTVPEFSVDQAPMEVSGVEPAILQPATAQASSPWPTAKLATEPEFAVVDEFSTASAEEDAAAGEIDLSSEWDDTVTVDTYTPATEEGEVGPAVAAGGDEIAESDRFNETVDEIRFYLAHGMPAQALAALARLQTLSTDQTRLDELRAEVEAATQTAPEEETAVAAEPDIEEIAVEDIPSIEDVDEVPVRHEEPAAVEPEPPAREEIPVAEVPAEPAPEPQPEPTVLQEFVTHLESSLGDNFLPNTISKPAERKPAPVVEPAVAAAQPAPVLGEFVADIEASLGEDFLKAAPVAEPQTLVRAQAQAQTAPLAASAAASAAPTSHIAPAAPHSVAPASTMAASAVHPVVDIPHPKPPAIPRPQTPAAAKASPFGEEAGVDLAEMFGELKQDLESGLTASDEDPETHYNLGIAFREMGLLDESIGELQKACQAFDRGHPFPQIMQTYTWLAQCFLEKGVPQAAVRWYDKALSVAGIDGETRVALNYELGSAYEAAGDKSSALKHFTEVYGTNIDYRDVAERIKALKS